MVVEGRYTRSPQVEEMDLDGEVMLVHLTREQFFRMEGVALEVWKVLTHGGTVSDAVHSVVSAYSVGYETASSDVRALVGELVAEGLVVQSDDASGATVSAT